MIVRSIAPLRLGLAGGGTDVSPYCDGYGGCVLNATINMFAHCTIESLNTNEVIFEAKDQSLIFRSESTSRFPLDGLLNLHKAVYNRVIDRYNCGKSLAIRVTTMSDAPAGSGLGTSSAIVVALLAAFKEYLSLSFGDYELARLAYEIERIDCNLAGGRQDQYAATFGGFNFIEFFADDRVLVNPLRISWQIEQELQSRLLLFFTGVSRDSAAIIEHQIKTINSALNGESAYLAMHAVKQLSYDIKEKLLKGEINQLIKLFKDSWQAKKMLSSSISNGYIDMVEEAALNSGAEAVKISGAGGGGFMMIFIDPLRRLDIIRSLSEFGGVVHRFQFYKNGAMAWTVVR